MKIKRSIAMCLITVTAVSSMCGSSFAADKPIGRLQLECPQSMLSNADGEIRKGVLPCGLAYEIVPMTAEEIKAANSGISQHSYSWTGNVLVPIQNADGTNGAVLGGVDSFIIAPDNTVEICVFGLPSTMPTVNIGIAATNGMWKDWMPSIGSYTKVSLTPGEGYTVYSYKATVSTSESKSVSARFSIETV